MSIHEQLYRRAQGVLPGGVTSPVRAFRAVGGSPRYIARAEGARLHGEGGEVWTDYCLAWGPLILGHAHPAVVEATTRAARDGLCFGTTARGEIALAEAILEGYPRLERVRFVCSGTEAVVTALRLARAATGRDLILKFSGGYHGASDAVLVRAGSGLVSFGTGDSAGVPAGTARDTLVAPLDGITTLQQVFAEHGDRIAAAIVEPVPANNGLLVQTPAWLAALRAACTAHGALLIFDEVITGFRFGYGGAERMLGVSPDLVTLGKIIGGGLPLAAVAGSAAVMDQLAPLGPVYQAGTMAGNPVAVAAGRATLGELRDGRVYAHLDALGAAFDRLTSSGGWVRVGPILWPWPGPGPAPRSAESLPSALRAPFADQHQRWLNRGIYWPPSAYEVGFLCAAHQVADLEALVAATLER